MRLEIAGEARRAVNGGMQACRRLLAFLLPPCLLGAAQAQVLSSRIWPAHDYTRLTHRVEGRDPVQRVRVKEPERLVLDLEIGGADRRRSTSCPAR